jgi:hypothetical protein
MDNQERQVIDGIFERLKNVATQSRDPEAERYIAELVQKQPYAPYALAQSVYVQEQALLNQQQQIEQMQAEIAELQSRPAQPAGGGGFLSGLFGGGNAAPQRPSGQAPAYGQRREAAPPAAGPWGGQPQPAQAGPWGGGQQAAQPRQGMGFLGTAAAAAAGVAGGMMLGSILSNALGGGQAQAATPAEPASAPAEEQYDSGYDNASDTGGWDDGGGDSFDV